MAETPSRCLRRRKTSLARALGGDIVVISIGAQQKKFLLHKAVLMHHSEYFGNALKGPWKEAEDGAVALADVDVEAFEVFAQWLYTQEITHEKDITEDVSKAMKVTERAVKMVKTTKRYLEAFVFGDRFLAHHFRRAVHKKLDSIMTWANICTQGSVTLFQYAFDNIPSHYPLLQHLVDEYRHALCIAEEYRKINGIGKDSKEIYLAFSFTSQLSLPVELLVRVSKGIQQFGLDVTSERHRNWSKDCCYFEHVDEEEKVACKKMHVEYDEYMGHGLYKKEAEAKANVSSSKQ